MTAGAAPSHTCPVGGTDRDILRRTPGWDAGIDRLLELKDRSGARAEAEADAFGMRYEHQRAAMVFDVVQSANRRYDSVVVPRVTSFQQTAPATSLRALAELGPPDTYGFRRNERPAMMRLAQQLADFCDSEGVSDDDGCRRWASSDDPGVLHHLDPVIGWVKGIGFTLYRYLRMRAGADDLKPDRRVADGLERLGFPRFHTPEQIYVLAMAVARESEIRPLVLDQLLWFDDA